MSNNKKMLMLIPIIGLFAIPQLIYFWLAPVEAPCYTAVYIFGTLVSLIHLVVAYILCDSYSIRVSAGVIAVSSVIWMVMLIACAVLLAAYATVRTAVFSLSIIVIMYIIATITLLCVMETEPQDSISPRIDDDISGSASAYGNTISTQPSINRQGEDAPNISRYTQRESSAYRNDSININRRPLPRISN